MRTNCSKITVRRITRKATPTQKETEDGGDTAIEEEEAAPAGADAEEEVNQGGDRSKGGEVKSGHSNMHKQTRL